MNPLTAEPAASPPPERRQLPIESEPPTGSPMSRLATLSRHPRRTLATLATVLAAVGVTVASGADFTASSANPANTFSTGTLTMSNSSANSAILSLSGMRPTDTTTGTVDIANTGSLSGAFSLTRGTPDDSNPSYPLSTKLS